MLTDPAVGSVHSSQGVVSMLDNSSTVASSKDFIQRCESIVRGKIQELFKEGEHLAIREIHDLCKDATIESINMGDHRAKYDDIMATKDAIGKICVQVLESLPFGKQQQSSEVQPRGKKTRLSVGKNTYSVEEDNLVVETKYSRNLVPLALLEKIWELVSVLKTYNKSNLCQIAAENKGQSFVLNGVAVPAAMPHTVNFGLIFLSAAGLSKLRGGGAKKQYTVVGNNEDYRRVIAQITRKD